MKIYTYKNCGTCRKAIKWLREKGVEFDEIPIRDTPPTQKELKLMLSYLGGSEQRRRLFNTSGGDYRALDLKNKLPDMEDAEAIRLLASNGNLIKRPFLLLEGAGTVGFNESEWSKLL